MEFAGLKDTNLTYDDKIVYWETLKRKYGLITDLPKTESAVAKEK